MSGMDGDEARHMLDLEFALRECGVPNGKAEEATLLKKKALSHALSLFPLVSIANMTVSCRVATRAGLSL